MAPPGNSPELNTLDSNCNHDIHCAVIEYVALIAHIKKTDKRKFSVDSPKNQDDTYMLLWDYHEKVLSIRLC
eukprot:5072011-Ditylum_brightwellii.AAC.1